jgi:hypothetical protein
MRGSGGMGRWIDGWIGESGEMGRWVEVGRWVESGRW